MKFVKLKHAPLPTLEEFHNPSPPTNEARDVLRQRLALVDRAITACKRPSIHREEARRRADDAQRYLAGSSLQYAAVCVAWAEARIAAANGKVLATTLDTCWNDLAAALPAGLLPERASA